MGDHHTPFRYDGDVTGYLHTRLVAGLVTVATIGFGFPVGLVLVQRWNARHLSVDGRHLTFSGRAPDLLRDWVRWWPLVVVTLGLYAFAVVPKVRRWVWDHTDLGSSGRPGPATVTTYAAPWVGSPLAPPTRLHTAFFTEAGRHRLG
jgi:uncharacterized membrane protein YjgN (DUF898 family)